MSNSIKTVRVIAKTADKANSHRTVNIITGAFTNPGNEIKPAVQSLVGPVVNEFETVFVGATGTQAAPPAGNGLPTLSIPGYTGPS